MRADAWTAIVAEAPPGVIEKLGKRVDFADPPNFYEFICEQWEMRCEGLPDTWEVLLESQIVLRAVADPAVLTVKEAVTLTGFAVQDDKQFDTKLLRRLLAHRQWPEEVPSDEVMRTLEVLEFVDEPQRLSMTLLKFSKFPDPRIQSKVAKILGRAIDSVEVMEELFNSRDGRVRANLLEGIGKRESIEAFLPLIERATRDQHTRVSSIALAIRAQLGHPGSAALIKMRSNSKVPTISASARFGQRIAIEKTSGRDLDGIELDGSADDLLGDVDTGGGVQLEAAVFPSIDEVHSKA